MSHNCETNIRTRELELIKLSFGFLPSIFNRGDSSAPPEYVLSSQVVIYAPVCEIYKSRFHSLPPPHPNESLAGLYYPGYQHIFYSIFIGCKLWPRFENGSEALRGVCMFPLNTSTSYRLWSEWGMPPGLRSPQHGGRDLVVPSLKA